MTQAARGKCDTRPTAHNGFWPLSFPHMSGANWINLAVVVGYLLMIVGVQTVFASFFLSVLTLRRKK